jgi:LacI family transcriptional regulator
MAITIKDLAKAAGVSVTTISRVVNGNYSGVSEETKNRILVLVNNMGYKPNAIARGLVTRRTKTIGLIIPDVSNEFFSSIARGAEDEANGREYNVFLCNTDEDVFKEKQYLAALNEKCVDGILYAGTVKGKSNEILNLKEKQFPLVIIDRQIEDIEISGVFIDNIEGAYKATNYLIKLGHSNIACITGPLSDRNACDRLEGYKKALKDNSIAYDSLKVMEGNFKVDGGMNAMKELLRIEKISAVFASNDLMAYGAYKIIKSRKMHIPTEISIIGFDDNALSDIIEPELTTIRQPAYEMGKLSARMLIDILEKKSSHKVITRLIPELVIRNSVSEKKL